MVEQELNLGLACIHTDLKLLERKQLDICNPMNDAIQQCILNSQIKYNRATLAAILDIDKSQLSKILNGKGYNFPPNKLPLLMQTCGNYAPLQYLLKELGFKQEHLEMLQQIEAVEIMKRQRA